MNKSDEHKLLVIILFWMLFGMSYGLIINYRKEWSDMHLGLFLISTGILGLVLRVIPLPMPVSVNQSKALRLGICFTCITGGLVLGLNLLFN